LSIAQKLLPFVGQENGYFCWSNCDLSGKDHTLKSPYIIKQQVELYFSFSHTSDVVETVTSETFS